MRKLSKILAVVLSVVLLCGMIATMISADAAEIIYPEYTTPSVVTKYAGSSSDFEEGSALPGAFGASNGFMMNKITAGGNTYAQVTNINSDGTLATHTSRSMMNLFSPYQNVAKFDYVVISFDIMADRYTNGTDIKTPAEYAELADTTGYYPTFATTRLTFEAMGVIGYGDTAFLWIKQDATTKQWYVSTSAAIADATSYPLPTEAGVWTNITYAITYDVNVVLGEESISYAQYLALSAEEKAAYASAKVIVNSTLDIYVNGEFAFNIAAGNKTNSEYAIDGLDQTGNKLKYNQFQYGASSSSRADVPVSYGIDNVILAGYADGYNGDFATALANNTSFNDTNDAIFNKNYNMTKQLGATVTKADGKVYGYMTVEQAFKAAENGDTVEILVDNAAVLVIDNESAIKSLTVKTNNKAFKYDLAAKYETVENEGVVSIAIPKYGTFDYVGPVGPEKHGKSYDYESDASDKFNATTDKNEITVAEKTVSGNTYSTYTYTGTGTQSGETIRLNSWYNTPILTYDYITLDIDIVAEGYRNISSGALITIDAYNALSDADKAAYEPSYTIGSFYHEYAVISTYDYFQMLLIKKIGGKYALCDYAESFVYFLPEEAGVWTHITWLTKIGNDITYYTDDTKTTTATMSYAEYKASGKGETYYKSVNLSESTQSIFVNGEYQGDIAKWTITTNDTTAYANLAKVYYKYLFFKGVNNTNTSSFKQSFAIGFDNAVFYKYAEGYNGDILNAKTTGLYNCTDTVFNEGYNKAKSPYIIGVTNAGEEQGMRFTNVESAMNYAKTGATIELLAKPTPKLNITGLNNITVITNGYAFGYYTNDSNIYADKIVDGNVVIATVKYVQPEYVGPVATKMETFDTGSAAYGTGAATTTSALVQGGTKYDQYSFAGGSIANAKDWLSLPAYYVSNLLDYEYLTIEYDITADKYTNGTDLITVEEYNALSDEAKAAYYPSYFESVFYWEFKQISSNYSSRCVAIHWMNDAWYLVDNSAPTINYYKLPTEAGVWTHVAQVVEIGNTATYNTADGTATCSFKEFRAMVNAGTVAASDLVSVNVSESKQHVYVNGEYLFTFDNWVATNKDNDTYANYTNTNCNDAGKAYAIKYGRWRNSGAVTAPFSVGLDNQAMKTYADGYTGAFATAITNKTSTHNCSDAIFNKTYNLTGSYVAAVYGEDTGFAYAFGESAYASVTNGDTIELLADANAIYTPLVEVTYIKTNGYEFKYNLPEGYTYYETETEGTYVIKVAGPEDYVEVEWYVDGELYATTTELIGTTPEGPEYALTKVHPWVSRYVDAWVDANGNSIVKSSDNKFDAAWGYELTAEILMNISTTQAIITNAYIPALTEEEMAQVSGISYAIGTTQRWGSKQNVTVGGKSYYKFSETNRIIYNERDRRFVFSFTYDGVELSAEINVIGIEYFDKILGSNEYSQVEKELIYSALYYADAVARYNTFSTSNGFVELVAKYAEYKTQKTSVEDIVATATKQNNTSGLVTGFNLSLYDGYAAFFNFVLDTNVAGADFDRATATITYKTLAGGAEKVVGTRQYKDGNLTFDYSISIYDVRQTLTLVIGETESTFNLASYIKALVDGGYAVDSAEMTIALALYNYSECSEAYKRS